MKPDIHHIEEIITRFRKALPRDLQSVSTGVDDALRSTLNSALAKMDVVSREEYEVQKQVLLRTRQRLQALEERVKQIESETPAVK